VRAHETFVGIASSVFAGHAERLSLDIQSLLQSTHRPSSEIATPHMTDHTTKILTPIYNEHKPLIFKAIQ